MSKLLEWWRSAALWAKALVLVAAVFVLAVLLASVSVIFDWE